MTILVVGGFNMTNGSLLRDELNKTANWSNSFIYEIKVWNYALTDAEILAETNALKAKYNLQ